MSRQHSLGILPVINKEVSSPLDKKNNNKIVFRVSRGRKRERRKGKKKSSPSYTKQNKKKEKREKKTTTLNMAGNIVWSSSTASFISVI